MAKHVLDKTWIYAGKFYGPGDVDLPDAVHAALKERGAFDTPAVVEEAPPQGGLESLPPDVIERLAAAGFGSAVLIRAASDDALLTVEGVGVATLRRIRAVTQE